MGEMSQNLAARKCEACVPGTPPIDPARAAELQREIDPDWKLEETRIRRRFKFPDFREALAFANKVGDLAEEEGHHPDLGIGWGYVSITLTTHAAKGLTGNDFIMAAKIDDLLSNS